jgi:RimJ/RimL family protein N-acetyltransferase
MEALVLREMVEDDLAVFFEHQREPAAVHMAAFTSADPADRDAFMVHWGKLLDAEGLIRRTVVVEGGVAGMVVGFESDGVPEVTYWLGEAYWGRGLATRALRRFLQEDRRRPLYARAAKDNAGSIRVLENCGFVWFGEAAGYAPARGEVIAEVVYRLGDRGPSAPRS